MLFIGKPSKMGIKGLNELCSKVKANYKFLSYKPLINDLAKNFIKDGDVIFITGIGSSETHARYLEQLLMKNPNIFPKYRPIMDFYSQNFDPSNTKLILFS